jgi:four helix bundle protein
MTTDELKRRTKSFALQVTRLVAALPNTVKGRAIANQIMCSAPSVAANYRPARGARSRAEFIAKIGVVEQEADETAFGLELIVDTDLCGESQIERLLREAGELIMAASRKSAIGNRESEI